MINEINNKYINYYLEDENYFQDLKSKQKLIDKLLLKNIGEEENKYLKIKSKSYEIFKFVKLFRLRSLFKPKPKIPNEFVDVLKSAKFINEKNNSKLYFIYIPNITRYFDLPYINYDNEIERIVTSQNISFIDLDDYVFSKVDNPKKLFPFNQIGHPNIDGYNLIANTINEIIENEK